MPSYYMDASILIALLSVEPFSERADAFVRVNPNALIISDFAGAEFASAIARRVRMREVTADEGRADLSGFDTWVAAAAQQVEITNADVATATTFLRRLDLPLRTPDAIHIAIVQRLGATLVTFDRRMAASARAIGAAVAEP
jgi:predicted nucleic acid-binding protein